jgi:hypothetical protein
MTKPDLARELDYPIDTLLIDLEERLEEREPRGILGVDEPPFDPERRASDVAAIRGLILAIRALRSVRIVGEAREHAAIRADAGAAEGGCDADESAT